MRLSPEQRSLAAAHHDVVIQVAARVARRLPMRFSRDDLVDAGYIGLVEAAARWEPERGVPFDAYARIRVAGAMLDETRRRWSAIELQERFQCPAPAFTDAEDLWDAVRAVVGRRACSVLRGCFGRVDQETLGAAIGVGQSRTSQIRTEAIATLRSSAWFRREFGPETTSPRR